MKSISHTKLTAEFKRQAAVLMEQHIPGKVHLARRDVHHFLLTEKRKLYGWYCAMIYRFISFEEFGSLFGGVKQSFELRYLKLAGLSPEQLRELTELLRKLYRAMIISSVQSLHSEFENS